MAKLGTISYVNPTSGDGFSVAKRGSMTMIGGISPSSATIVTVPQPQTLPDTGTLTFAWQDGGGDDVVITFLDCAVNQASLRKDGGAFLWTIQILDRRWKWRFGDINGEYNVRLKDGSIDIATEKTPQELARLLFDAMGEDEVGEAFEPDATLLPNDSRPYVRWDRTNPARELATLCESLGCIVVLKLDNVVKIYPLETGTILPTTNVASSGSNLLYKIAPSTIKLVGAPIEFQSRLQLEAVGLDTDDEIKPLADLSYDPLANVGGDPFTFSNLFANEDHQKLAVKTCFRWYRVSSQLGTGGNQLPGGSELLAGIDQIRLKNGLMQETTNYGAKKQRKKPVALGDFNSLDIFNKDTQGVYTGPFTVDTKNNIVKFRKPVFRNETGVVLAGDMVVEIAYNAIGNDGALIRYDRSQAVPNIAHSTPPRIIKHYDDVERTIRVTYDTTIPGAENGLVDTEAEADIEADYYLNAETATYNIEDANFATYGGLVAINNDGLVKSVSWSIGDGPTVTAASGDSRLNPYVPNFDAKRNIEKQRDREEFERDFGEGLAAVLDRLAETEIQ